MRKIPFFEFTAMHEPLKKEIMQAIESCYDKGQFILGEEVSRFEAEYAEFCEVKHCIGVSNGLDALILSLRVLDICPGDEVIVPSNTYIATCLAVTHTGANIAFAEPDPLTYNISPKNIEVAITSKTRAIIPVHLYGRPCEMDSIMSIAEKHGLYVVEDNAQSQGASYSRKKTGSYGHINATSFYPGKNLGALGDAGAITTNDDNLAEKVRALRNYGSAKKYYNDYIGYNMRLDEMQATVLRIKLKQLSNWNEERRALANRYHELLMGITDLTLSAKDAAGEYSVYHQFVIRSKQRDALQEHLKKNGIDTLIHYPVPPHKQKAYSHLALAESSYPLAEEISNTVLSLPIYPGLKEDEQEYVAEMVRSFFQ